MKKTELTKEEKLNLVKGLIYKIYSPENPNFLYIGSTTSSLKDRLKGHQRSYRRWKRLQKGYLASFKIFEKFGVDNVVIEKLDKLYFRDDEKIKLIHLEGKYQRKYNCVNVVTNNETEKIYTFNSLWKCKTENDKIDMENNPFKGYIYKQSNKIN